MPIPVLERRKYVLNGFIGHTTYSGKAAVGKIRRFRLQRILQSVSMPDFDFNDFSQRQNRENKAENAGELSEEMLAEQDLLMEEIVNNLNSTPMGQVLKKLASLPEVRQQKVLNVRQQLTSGSYDLGERLDVVLDKVLEELTA